VTSTSRTATTTDCDCPGHGYVLAERKSHDSTKCRKVRICLDYDDGCQPRHGCRLYSVRRT
jgi:hypothetical protein